MVETLVVGAGSAGAIIASRVTERGDRDVLLLEAGPDYPDPSALPADLADGRWNSMTRHDWGYTHHPTPRQPITFPFPRGRVVGGSSAVNTCIALRPHPGDFDGWAARGLSEWSWADCLPAFCRLETDREFGDRPHHGDDGPLPIHRATDGELAAWQAAFLEGCDHMGLPRCEDANAPDALGWAPHPVNRVAGRRVSAAEAWLSAEVRGRDNLTIQPDTLVRRVLFEGRKAVGVEVERAGQVEVLRARRIVLAAGAINTPGVLLRSGIGPRADLERLGVEEVLDAPAVGAKLLDHPGAAVFFRPRFRKSHRNATLIQVGMRYHSGLPGASPVDMQLQPGSAFRLGRLGLPLFSMMCAVNDARGIGQLRYDSADPRARPHIDARILSHPDDRRRALAAMRLAYEVAATPPMRALATPLWPRPKTLADDGAADAWIDRSCDSGYHPCASAPMGAEHDPEAALDGRGRVRGVEGLWVCDASAMPTCPSANINLTVLMMGERFGAWLRDG